jgi:Na+/melibiose symporter-like transporter
MNGFSGFIADKITEYWNRYQPYFIGFAVGLVLGWLL